MSKLHIIIFLNLIVFSGLCQTNSGCPNGIIIGNTEFYNQSNYGSSGRLIYEWPNNNKVAVWTLSTSSPPYLDRGTGYNFYNGSWNNLPSTRIESERTGFPNIIGGNNSEELIFSHNVTNMYFLNRVTAGTGPWLENSLTPIDIFWPRFARGGPNNQTIHLIGNKQLYSEGQFSSMRYWRSSDVGITWDLQNIIIPQLDSTQTLMSFPSANISCKGNTVAIVVGGFTDDLILVKSLDNGVTWTKTIINQFPIPLYNPDPMITDVNNDGIADTVSTVDGSTSVLIDNSGIVHIWAGKSSVIDVDPLSSYGFFPLVDGLLYWNETMPPNTILGNLIAELEDMNNDGYLNIPDSIFPKNCNATSMVTSGVDASNKLFVAYAGYVEDTINPIPSPFEARRNIYFTSSIDNGLTWTTPNRLCPNDYHNQFWPSMTETVFGDPDIVFFRDTNGINFFPHHLEVICISPNTSTSIIEPYDSDIHFTVWQQDHQNGPTIEIKSTSTDQIFNFTLYDLIGNEIDKFKVQKNQITETKFLDMNKFLTGIYFLKAESNKSQKVEKILFKHIE